MNLKLTSNYFLYFPANCIPIKGYNRSCIYDLNRKKEILIENEMYNFILRLNNINSDDLANFSKTEEEYLKFMYENDLLLKVPIELKNNFPAYDDSYHIAFHLNNSILDIDNNSTLENISIIESLGCLYIQLRILELIQFINLQKLKSQLENSSFRYIEIILDFCFFESELISTFQSIPQVMCIFLINSPPNARNDLINNNLDKVFFSPQKNFNNYLQNYQLFVVNNSLFNESQHFNTYLNKKIYITKDGVIQNVPESKISFGKLNSYSNLSDIITLINSDEFTVNWKVKKDLIDVCCHCEFRHMCVDSSPIINRKDGSMYREFECNYNPYISRWKDEEGYYSLKEIGVVCDFNTHSIDHEKINYINSIIWKET